MNIPSPAAVKKQTDARKAREAELASSLANAKETMPPTKAMRSSKPSSKVSTKAKRSSEESVSSPKGKGSLDRSSNSVRPNKSSQKQRFAEAKSRSNSESDVKVRTGTSKVSRKSQNQKSSETNSPRTNSKTSSGSDQKTRKPFVRPDHLTSRPLSDNKDLEALRKSLTPSSKARSGSNNRAPRTVPRRISAKKQSQGQQTKKENN